jgi:hypothetical protein
MRVAGNEMEGYIYLYGIFHVAVKAYPAAPDGMSKIDLPFQNNHLPLRPKPSIFSFVCSRTPVPAGFRFLVLSPLHKSIRKRRLFAVRVVLRLGHRYKVMQRFEKIQVVMQPADAALHALLRFWV